MNKVVRGSLSLHAAVWGRCERGQLGLGLKVAEQPLPKSAKWPQSHLVQLCQGPNHSLLLAKPRDKMKDRGDKDTHYRVMSFGSGKYGKLGHHQEEDCTRPEVIESIPGFERGQECIMGAGSHHSLIWNGESLISFGRGTEGQLGRLPTHSNKHEETFDQQTIKSLNKTIITLISCGEDFSLCATDKGDVLGFGQNDLLQLGQESDQEKHLLPVKIHGLDNITCLASGWGHSIAIRADGSVFSFGSSIHGQCGTGVSSKAVPVSRIPDEFFEGETPIHASCGAAHSAFLTSEGSVFMCGSAADGHLGIKNDTGSPFEQDTLYPARVSVPKTKDIRCGANHTIILTTSGEILSWGFGQHFSLGDGSGRNSSSPVKVEYGLKGKEVLSIHAGMDVSMALFRGD